ncbi:MAG: LamG domain-containing protein, partial [Flavobacterium sp.]
MRKSHSSRLLLCGWIMILTSNMCLAQSFSAPNNAQATDISPSALSTSSQLSLTINPINLAVLMEPLVMDFGIHPISTQTFTINRKWRVLPSTTIGKTSIEIHENFLSNLEVPDNSIPVIIVSDEEYFLNDNELIPLNKLNNHLVGTYHFNQLKYITLGFAKISTIQSHVHFNGINDFIKVDTPEFSDNNFTISTWIKISNQNTSNQEKTILNLTGLNNEIQFNLNSSNKLTFSVNDSNQSFSFSSNTSIPSGKWHHISLTKEIESISMHIDGVLDSSSNLPFDIDNTFDHLFIGARKNMTSMAEFFNGDIDEFRIWNIALSTSEFRLLMNQEIEKKGRNKITGAVWNENQTFQPLKDLKWEQLSLYFSMNHFIGNQLLDRSNNQKTGAFSNSDLILIQNQTAPLPYTTASSGEWFETETWKNGSEIQLPCSPSIVDASVTVEWDIVNIEHDVFSHGNKTLSGLKINEGTLFAKNNSKIEVSHYLKLMGTIDLVGTSQLIQTLDSYLDPHSSGKIERDQQGTPNRFNYNYWCSPVGNQNNTLVNHGHSVSGVMRDGTNPNNPIPMSWVSGVNPPVTSNPITLSSYWIFRFQNMTPTYANWTGVGANGWLQAGHGFTMKGSNQATASQNYVFVGKPNNGRITSQIGPNNLNLTGNPYPSALDAHQFIKDNINS